MERRGINLKCIFIKEIDWILGQWIERKQERMPEKQEKNKHRNHYHFIESVDKQKCFL